MGEERKVGLHIGSGNLSLAFFRTIGQFASSEVIRLNDRGSSHSQMPAVIHLTEQLEEAEMGRSAKLKSVKMAENVFSPIKLLAEGLEQVKAGEQRVSVEALITKLVTEVRDQAGFFGDFSECSVAYPDYLNTDQLLSLKNALRAEITELEDRHFVPVSFATLFDMQLHQARYNLGFHKFDFSQAKKVMVIDIGENFTTSSIFEVTEVGQEIEARYLAKPCSSRFGGRDFDGRFADYLIDQAILKGTLTEQQVTSELRRQIHTEAEKFKRDLVEKVDAQVMNTHLPPGKMNDITASVRIYDPSGKKILEHDINKREYEAAVFSCIAEIHEDTPCVFQSLTGALNLADLRPGDIDEVVLVGGMSRLHLIAQVLKHTFGYTPREFANPELVAVRGASVYHDMVSSPLEMRL
jgi:molecular chaperone DnaK